MPVSATFVQADVTSEAEAQEAVDRAVALAPLRVLVNCAGVGWGARIVDRNGKPHDLALFRQILDINLVGASDMLRLAAVAMAANDPAEREERVADAGSSAAERGVIINTASIAAFEGQVGQAAYAASKAGIVEPDPHGRAGPGVAGHQGGVDRSRIVRDSDARSRAGADPGGARPGDGLAAPLRRPPGVRVADLGDRAKRLSERRNDPARCWAAHDAALTPLFECAPPQDTARLAPLTVAFTRQTRCGCLLSSLRHVQTCLPWTGRWLAARPATLRPGQPASPRIRPWRLPRTPA